MDEVIFERDGHIAFIKLNRPERLNAINRPMKDQLVESWIRLRDDESLWVGIVSGEGRAFCSGADVREMERGQWKFRDSLLFGDKPLGPSNYGVWKPLIAATHGHVNGAGLYLALECDLRISSEDALFGASEAKVNIPALIAPFLSNHLPQAIAAELLYTARPIDASRAYQLGLVNRVGPRNGMMDEALKVAESICECGPLSVWASKELAARTCHMDTQSALALVEHIATPVWNSEDSIEAKRAFIEKRKPIWRLK
jgi:enoyl-CoA hydratase/carnithine racemase